LAIGDDKRALSRFSRQGDRKQLKEGVVSRQIIFVAPEGVPELFKRVVAALGEDIKPAFKNMDLLPAGQPNEDWTLDGEVHSLLAFARAEGFETFDLVGYSGGAAVSLAFAALHPARLRSLTLIEPPWIGNDIWSEEERGFVNGFDALLDLPPNDLVASFFELFAPGTNLPVPPDEKRVTRMAEALRIVWLGYRAKPLDRSLLAKINAPVYLPVGGRSAPRMKALAELLAIAFRRARVKVFAEQHHFDLLQRAAADLAIGLSKIWSEEADTK
jgi:pimeloyl-ACP methyl ester carboxylesterase